MEKIKLGSEINVTSSECIGTMIINETKFDGKVVKVNKKSFIAKSEDGRKVKFNFWKSTDLDRFGHHTGDFIDLFKSDTTEKFIFKA